LGVYFSEDLLLPLPYNRDLIIRMIFYGVWFRGSVSFF